MNVTASINWINKIEELQYRPEVAILDWTHMSHQSVKNNTHYSFCPRYVIIVNNNNI